MADTTVLPITHIVSTPTICGGVPRIHGTRITVDWIVGQMLYAGRTIDQMVQELCSCAAHTCPDSLRTVLLRPSHEIGI
jgi:uncharacterized protein (DUF433 family)